MFRNITRVVFSLAFVCAAAPSLAAKKPLEQYWQDVSLKFNFIEPEMSTDRCYSDERTFIACAYAVNAMLAYQTTPLVLVPRARLQSQTGFGAVAAELGGVVIVPPIPFESDDVVAIYQHDKDERQRANQAWQALFRDRDRNPVKFEDVLAWVKKSPVFAQKESVLTAAAANALLMVTKDPHTMLLPADYVREESSAGSDDFTGVGVQLKTVHQNGHKVYVIEQPIEGGPALAAGLRANDVLLEIDEHSTESLTIDQVSELIRGPRGQAVRLTVRRRDRTLTFNVVRDRIRQPNVSSKLLASAEVGYVKLATFMKDDGCEALTDAVKDLESKGAKSLVLDLRGNGGGLVMQALCIANIFLKKDELVVSTKGLGAFGPDQELRTTRDAVTHLPLVVLVNARSASASELLSGALQDDRRAFVVGERTFGKGTVQSQSRVAGGKLVLRQTIAKFYLPSGRSNQIAGVIPDLIAYRVPNPTAEDRLAFREEDEYMAFPTSEAPWQQPRADEVKQLETCVGEDGTAAREYAAGSDAALPPDYQLLIATDTARCVNRLGLPAEEEHPTYRPQRLAWHWGNPARDVLYSLWQRLNQRYLP